MLLKGYWGDIVISPLFCFGLEADDESLFKKSNDEYTKVTFHRNLYKL